MLNLRLIIKLIFLLVPVCVRQLSVIQLREWMIGDTKEEVGYNTQTNDDFNTFQPKLKYMPDRILLPHEEKLSILGF